LNDGRVNMLRNYKLSPSKTLFFSSAMFTVLLFSFGLVDGDVGRRAQAQTPPLVEAEEAAFQQAVSRVAASVVQIETFGGLERVGEELIAEGPTTGTIVDAEGWIISSLFSFRQQPASILVSLPNGKRAAARIVARDFSRELALLKVEVPEPLPVAPIAPKDSVIVGGWAVALGKTYDKQSVSQSVGIISAVDRAYGKAIQTDAKVSPINYGGPLIDISGRIIGILSPISPGTFLEGDSSQLYDSGIGFAIPTEDIAQRLSSMKSGADIRSGKLGVVSGDQNELIGPVRISGTAPGSPAAKALMQAGDVIVEAGGQPIKLLAHLKHALGPVDAGQPIDIVVERAGKRIAFSPTLTDEIPVYRRRYLGLRLLEGKSGLEITGVEANSPAGQASLRIGESITHCNGMPLSTKNDLLKILAVAELDQPLQLQLLPVAAQPETATKSETKSENTSDPKTGGGVEGRTVEVTAMTWPEQIPDSLPKIDARIEENMATEVVDVVLGDFPNKAFAIIPPLASDRPLGLLVVFPEPGELERTKSQTFWGEFCRDFGWIVAVVNSGNPRGWSREEVELAGRVIGRLDKSYELDKSRTVIAGLGVGGRIALAAALTESSRVSGAMVVGTELARFRWPKQNAPLQSIDFLFVGEAQRFGPITQGLQEMGYVADTLSPNNLDVSKWDTFPAVAIQRWLAGLGRL
jgi:S1-C subfamily serine protease